MDKEFGFCNRKGHGDQMYTDTTKTNLDRDVDPKKLIR